MLGQAGILFVLAAVLLITPHSVCHRTSAGLQHCGGGSDAGAVLALGVGAVVVIVIAVALLAQAAWARPPALVSSALLALSALTAIAVTYVRASAADRSTYAVLWVIGLIIALLLSAPVGLLWRKRDHP